MIAPGIRLWSKYVDQAAAGGTVLLRDVDAHVLAIFASLWVELRIVQRLRVRVAAIARALRWRAAAAQVSVSPVSSEWLTQHRTEFHKQAADS